MKRKASFELGLFAEDRARLEADIAELIGSAGDPHDLGSRVRDLVARHTGDSLQHYQRRLALAQSAGAVGCFEIDMTTGASAGTAAFFSNYGKPPDTGSWSHDEWFAHVHPDDRGRVSEQLRRVLATGREEELEYRIVRTDGAVVWVLTRTHLEHDASGRVTRAYGTQQDITRRKLTELALADREAQLTTVFGQAMVGIIHRSADGALIDVNGRFCEMMGRSREELESLTWRDLAHPDDVPATHAEYQMHLASGAPFVSEKRYVRPDGTVIWGKTQVTAVLGPDGSIASVVAIVDDVTERKLAELALAESEEHHRNFVEVNPGLFWTATPNGRITIVNSIGAEMLGMPHDVEEAGGVPQLVHPDDVERVRGEWGHALATGEPFRSEHRLRMADGDYRWMQIQASPVMTPRARSCGGTAPLATFTTAAWPRTPCAARVSA